MADTSMPGIADLAQAYRNETTTPREAVDACLARIEAHNDKIGAFELIFADRARQAADAAGLAMKAGHRLGPFHGVPFALKDLIDVEGEITTGGANVYADRVAKRSAVIAQRLIAGGGILIGKTKTVEVAYGPWGTNTQRGTPWNPWDMQTHRAPGGSSSGSGAGVASGFMACAVGTDTGGSVRIPAAFCGLTGLKVTEGHLPLDGIVPLSHTLDTPGPMCRSALDAAIMFQTMEGRAPGAIETALAEGQGLYGAMATPVEGLSIGVMTAEDRAFIDPAVNARFEEATKRLANLGARLVPFPLPVGVDAMRFSVATIIGAEGYYYHGEHYDNPDNAGRMDEHVKARIIDGQPLPTSAYIKALRQRLEHKALFLDAMRGLAAVVTPTVPIKAPIVEEIDQTTAPSQLTRMVNHLGFCALSTPMGLVDGLPAGLQIMCRGGEEAMALRLGAAFEKDAGLLGLPAL
ncbi:MAG: amidase [Pseudomonadota bacterium]